MIKITLTNNVDKVSGIISAFCDELMVEEKTKDALLANIGGLVNFVAEDGDSVVGAGGFSLIGDVPIGEYLYVVPGRRKGNIGGLILRAGLMHTGGRLRVAVKPERVKLYEKIGFKPIAIILEKGGK